MARPRLVVGISGASGAIYGVRLLEILRRLPVESHLAITRAAEVAVAHETGRKIAEVKALADVCHRIDDLAAPPSSGSFRAMGMVVAPCSVRTVAEIAAGFGRQSSDPRRGDVALKERRPLALMVRETPLHAVHLENMARLAALGATIAPPVPAFYARPETLEEMVDHTLGRVLDLFGLDAGGVRRWGERALRE